MSSPNQFAFEYEEVDDDGKVTSYGGLPIVAEILRRFGASAAITEHIEVPSRQHDAAWCTESVAMLMAAGGDCLDDMNLLVDDKGGRGYQPVIAVWAEQDLVVADEFRDGNVPAGKDTLPLLKRAFGALPESIVKRRLRADSALYNLKTLRWLVDEGIGYTISADMSAPLRDACVALTEEKWVPLESRENEYVHVAEVDWCPGDWANKRPRPRYLGIRFSPRQGSLFEGAGPKYLAIVTHREGDPAHLVRWHWEKAGTVEHVHDVLKHELGAGTFPCGRFGANAAWYRIALLTYNALSPLRSVALPPILQDARPKRLRFHVFVQPAEIISHARTLIARVRKRWHQCLGLSQLRLAYAP